LGGVIVKNNLGVVSVLKIDSNQFGLGTRRHFLCPSKTQWLAVPITKVAIATRRRRSVRFNIV
jgi:hypothetical protein